MKDPSFSGKPSPAHILWRDGDVDSGRPTHKRFDEPTLRKWCSNYGVDVETPERVDHERSDEVRQQLQCVFSWQEDAGEHFEIDGSEWDIEAQKTPRTFVEIDTKGLMRVKSWDSEYVLDVYEIRYDGASLVLRAEEFDGPKRLEVTKLRSREN
ncbi:hypothetical protein VB773_11925 [Haloarculaceae archaeon H-GB2-1]|nr:hypothetical protein [Haloarculaceae archaeon H-GB1-1]MEA5386671.1 hypothetical protein [Haloarculaceae archaeon H-GB11]MEA5408194.1 hypothetical protein [Haloarculaceae archaeon H-GB2-1]